MEEMKEKEPDKQLPPAEQCRLSLIKTVSDMGYPPEFGYVIATELGTEKQMTRMIEWLVQGKPTSAEEIADGMLAIKAEFEKYREKKINEYYNARYNELLNSGPLDPDDED